MSNLPGSIHSVAAGAICEDCDSLAIVCIQGETDSMGAEYHNLCVVCRIPYDREASTPLLGTCSWCHVNDLELHSTRDYSGEGTGGPVYQACSPCIHKAAVESEKEYRDLCDEHGIPPEYADEDENDLDRDDYNDAGMLAAQ